MSRESDSAHAQFLSLYSQSIWPINIATRLNAKIRLQMRKYAHKDYGLGAQKNGHLYHTPSGKPLCALL